MTERRFVLVDFRYTNAVLGHIRLYEAGCAYDMRRGLAHAAANANSSPWSGRSIGYHRVSPDRQEVLTELEVVEAEGELKAL